MKLIHNKLITTNFAVGAFVIGFSLLSQPASAVNVSFVKEGNTVPDGWTNLNWSVDGKAGVQGAGDWEFATRKDNAQTITDQFNWNWQNQEEVPWILEWDGNTLSFSIQDQTISYYQQTPPATSFDGFYLWTRATTAAGKVAPGTTIVLQVNAVNGIDINPAVSSSAIAPTQVGQTNITKNFFASDTPITSLNGIATMSWSDGAPNPNQARAGSRVGLKIEGFSTPSASVPEPLTLLGSATALGFGAWFQKRAKKRTYSKRQRAEGRRQKGKD